LISANTYQLTTLLRGQRGTEWAVTQSKPNGSTKVYLLKSPSTGIPAARITASLNNINQSIKLKCVPEGRSLDSVATETTHTVLGNAIKPYAPGEDVSAVKDGSGNLIITWRRRARKYGQFNDGLSVPLDEAIEKYDLEILNSSGALKRSVTVVGTNTYTYSAANQTSDFGSTPTQLKIKVYQISGIRGRGYERATGVINLA
jgi:hypothetical protein